MQQQRLVSLLVFLNLVLVLLASGCATMRGIDEHTDFNPAGKISLYRDVWVQRNPPEVHVQPVSEAPLEMKVLFVPFRVTQQMSDPLILGYSTARTVWQTWLSMRIFPNLEFSGDEVPYRRDRAVQLARARGADMVVGGFVTRVYAGGTAGDSDLAIQLEAHDTRSGQLVWSMAQSGMIPAARTKDYFLFAAKWRMPSDPLHAISQAIASDMGTQVQDWISGPTAMTRMQEVDKKVHDTVFSRSDPVPAPRQSQEGAMQDESKPRPAGAF